MRGIARCPFLRVKTKCSFLFETLSSVNSPELDRVPQFFSFAMTTAQHSTLLELYSDKQKYKKVKASVYYKWSSHNAYSHNAISNTFLDWKYGHVFVAVDACAQLCSSSVSLFNSTDQRCGSGSGRIRNLFRIRTFTAVPTQDPDLSKTPQPVQPNFFPNCFISILSKKGIQIF